MRDRHATKKISHRWLPDLSRDFAQKDERKKVRHPCADFALRGERPLEAARVGVFGERHLIPAGGSLRFWLLWSKEESRVESRIVRNGPRALDLVVSVVSSVKR